MVQLGEPQLVRSFRLAHPAVPGDVQPVRSFRLARSPSLGRPLVVEALVVAEVLALLVAAGLPLLSAKPRVSCRAEVAEVRSAIAKYQIGLGNGPKNLYSLVGLDLLKAAPAPDGPSVSAGFVYDPAHGTYSGGTCPG